MGLYLCVFTDAGDDEELDGVEVGSYADFGLLRDTIAEQLEPAGWGTRFPVLMTHPDADGQWTADEALSLELELTTIAEELAALAPQELPAGWQADKARSIGLTPASLRDCFIDVDGEPLLERLADLARLASRERLPIWFQ